MIVIPIAIIIAIAIAVIVVNSTSPSVPSLQPTPSEQIGVPDVDKRGNKILRCPVCNGMSGTSREIVHRFNCPYWQKLKDDYNWAGVLKDRTGHNDFRQYHGTSERFSCSCPFLSGIPLVLSCEYRHRVMMRESGYFELPTAF